MIDAAQSTTLVILQLLRTEETTIPTFELLFIPILDTSVVDILAMGT